MLHHKKYCSFTFSLTKSIVNHDDALPESELNEYTEKTNQLWIARSRKKKLAGPFKELSSLIKREAVTSAEERCFKDTYIPGSFECTAEYKPRKTHAKINNKTVVETGKNLKREDTSFHDKRNTHLELVWL